MKILTIAALLLSVTACTTASAPQYYRAAGETNQLSISGQYNELSQKIDIFIDGTVILTGNLPIFSTDVELAGKYNSQPASAYCNQKETAFNSNIQCLVHINGERAATLTF